MSTVVQTEFSAANSASDIFGSISEAISIKGYAVIDKFISEEWVSELREEQQKQKQQGDFRPASTSRHHGYQVDSKIHGDQILWLDQQTSQSAQRLYLGLLEELRLALNRDLQLGLSEVETQAAIYPPGSFYQRHLDGFRRGNLRTLTAILYLNRGWLPSEGGALRLYLKNHPDSDFIDVPPESGRFVVFLSERFPHEVTQTQRRRLSVTSWFSRRPME